jgi:phosphoribosylformylglycinamidine cyclo-ligase
VGTVGLLFTGIHAHIGSKLRDATAHVQALEALLDFAAEIRQETGLNVEELNVGGGLGVRYLPEDEVLSVERFAALLTAALEEGLARRHLPQPRLLLEPGRAIVAEAGVTLYTVGVIKDVPINEPPGTRRYVAVDGGMSDNPRPQLYDAVYTAFLANRAGEAPDTEVRVAGKHCETDVLISSVRLPRPAAGDILATRGESAYVVDAGDHYLASLTEGLGTKSLVADAMYRLTGEGRYDLVARDTVATRWAEACAEAGAAWGGGETQAIAGIVLPEAITLAGAAVGVVRPKARLLLGSRVAPGDAILIAPAAGIHANGLTLARRAAEELAEGYGTPVPGDPGRRPYGEVLLDPAPLYGPLVEALLDAAVPLHYAVHVTGHGWRKLMRAGQPLTYVIDRLPEVPPVLRFLAERAGMAAEEAYGTFNMGAGFVFYLPAGEVERAQAVAGARGVALLHAGTVEPGPRRVVLRPLGVTYESASLRLRT